MATYLTLSTNGDQTEANGIATSAGAGDAGKLVQLNSLGQIDITQLPNGVGADAVSVVASEALAAGALVNIYSNAGTPNVRNAVATAVGMRADGYVIAAVTNGGTATVYFDDKNTGVTGLTPGSVYFLSDATPGAVITTPPVGTGKIVQKVGVATSATVLHVKLADPIIRA